MGRFSILLVMLAAGHSSAAELRLYGKESPVYFSLLSTDGKTLATVQCAAGDVRISKDGGVGVAAPCFVPVPNMAGFYSIVLAAVDLEAADVIITVKDAVPKLWADEDISLETYGHAKARHPFNIVLESQQPDPPKVTDRAIYSGTVGSGVSTPTTFEALVTDSANVAVTDITGNESQRSIWWVTGKMANQTYTINSDAASGNFVLLSVTAMQFSPSPGDRFIVW